MRARVLPLLAALLACAAAAPSRAATLRFSVVEDGGGKATPARVTLVDEKGRSHVPPTSLPVAGECDEPAPAWWAEAGEGKGRGASVPDPASGARAFYVDGPTEIDLAPGRYRLTASKGFEWRPRSVPIEVGDDGAEATVRLERWIDLPARGWFGADGHLHVSRPSASLDPVVGRWMEAEDLHVASLLAMGRRGGIAAARQYAFGAAGLSREGDALVASGQENPRTWVLGHGVVLGASAYLDPGERYLVYQPVWEQARAEGALSGYAHWFAPGVMIDAPAGLVDFLEVLQVDVPNYGMLYRLWDLGLRVVPTAGTDFPCLEDLPGSVRFYTRVDGELSWTSWLAGVRAGRTFVTNGPLLELRARAAGSGARDEPDESGRSDVRGERDEGGERGESGRGDVRGERDEGGERGESGGGNAGGEKGESGDGNAGGEKGDGEEGRESGADAGIGESAGVGDTLDLAAPGTVRVEAIVRFDPTRDDVGALEIVRDGEVVERSSSRREAGEIALVADVEMKASGWLAVRTDGTKLDRRPQGERKRFSAAHTAPIWVRVAGGPPLGAGERARREARAALAELAALRPLFTPEGEAAFLEIPDWRRNVGVEDLRASRAGVLAEIERASAWYAERAGPLPTATPPASRTPERTAADAVSEPPRTP